MFDVLTLKFYVIWILLTFKVTVIWVGFTIIIIKKKIQLNQYIIN